MADPISWINAGSSLLNALNGGGAAPAGPAISGAPTMLNNDLDFSGFTVATGQGKADGAKINKTSSDSLSQPGTNAGASASGGLLSNISPGLVLGLAAAAGLLWNQFNGES
ncbi:MAG: hypothetical protein J0H69_00625 [Burkholderiales bacterium]|nr:hypothetical protein [Burkholderiales bacterium]